MKHITIGILAHVARRIKTVISKVKSSGFFKINLLFFFAIFSPFYYITENNPIIHSPIVTKLNIVTILFSLHPHNSK